MYRIPTDDPRANFMFYQRAYRQGFTTELPTDENLEHLLKIKFEDTAMCYRYYISILRQLGLREGAKIFDFGCSWGYGSRQLVDAGYQVSASEISRPRAQFAKDRLGIQCTPEISKSIFEGNLRQSFDCFFSAHVLEHVPSPVYVVELAKLALRPGGFFVAITPNGGEAFKQRDPLSWHLLWGKSHPNLIDEKFYRYALSGYKTYLDTSPANREALMRFASGDEYTIAHLSGSELLCVSKF